MLTGASIIAAILVLNVQALHAREDTPPQEATEREEIDPRLWYTLATVEGRAELFTHWERVHPIRYFPERRLRESINGTPDQSKKLRMKWMGRLIILLTTLRERTSPA